MVKIKIKKWRSDVKEKEESRFNDLSKEVEVLERRAELYSLSNEDCKLRLNLRAQLRRLQIAKCKDIYQKARVKWIKSGDENSAYFHSMMKVKLARNRVQGLLLNGEWVSQPEAIKEEFRRRFKNLFSEPIRRRPSFTNFGLRSVSDQQAAALEADLNEEEVWEVIRNSDGDKAPGPDGFTIKFYKKFWDHLKPVVTKMLRDFFESGTFSHGCNASFVTLIPKVSDPQEFADYRPISLVSSMYKILSKVLANRLKLVLPSIIGPTQSAFVGGRNIMDCPLIISETVSWAKKSKTKLLIFKVDFQKAYDSINWKFLFKVMSFMRFPEVWIKWIRGCLESGRGSILVNGSPSREFNFKRGLRQGDPLSPFLFIIAMEAVCMLMRRAVHVGLFHGIQLPNGGPYLSHLCYADDVIFIGEWSEKNVISLKRFLRCLALVSGLRVNQRKCQLFGVGVDDYEVSRCANLLSCDAGSLPFTYLGIPIGANLKRAKYWRPVIDKCQKRLSAWKAKKLSFAGRITLAKSVLGSLPSYYLSLFKAPKVVIKKIESIRRDFVWGKSGNNSKIRWIRWDAFMKPKDYGGFGLGSIEEFNIAMLAKWWWRLKDDPGQLWAEAISAIHKTKTDRHLVPINNSISGMWKDIGNVDGMMRKLGISLKDKLKVEIGDGSKTSFWKDAWLLEDPLRCAFPDLYKLARNKDALVASNFRQPIGWVWDWISNPASESETLQWMTLQVLLHGFRFRNCADVWKWVSSYGNRFSVKEVRREVALKAGPIMCRSKYFWNSWAPLKNNYLAWRAINGRIAAKVELLKRGVNLADSLCSRCGYMVETADHVFVECIWARAIWWNMLRWMRITWTDEVNSLVDLVEAIGNNPGSKRWKRIVHVVMVATISRIWFARNKKAFEDNFIPVNVTVAQIKDDAFMWITHRAKIPSPCWESWVDFDILNLL